MKKIKTSRWRLKVFNNSRRIKHRRQLAHRRAEQSVSPDTRVDQLNRKLTIALKHLQNESEVYILGDLLETHTQIARLSRRLKRLLYHFFRMTPCCTTCWLV